MACWFDEAIAMSYHRSDSRWTKQRQTRIDFKNLLSECTSTRDPLPVTSEAEIGLADSENISVIPLLDIDAFNELPQSPDHVVAVDVDSHNGYQTRVCMNTENSTSMVCNKEIESQFVAAYHEHFVECSEQNSIEMNTNEEVSDAYVHNYDNQDGKYSDISCDDNYTSECDDDDILLDEISEWIVQFNISHSAVRQLLAILRKRHPLLPKDPRTVLKTCTTVAVTNIGGGCYYHVGLANGVTPLLDQFSFDDSVIHYRSTLTVCLCIKAQTHNFGQYSA